MERARIKRQTLQRGNVHNLSRSKSLEIYQIRSTYLTCKTGKHLLDFKCFCPDSYDNVQRIQRKESLFVSQRIKYQNNRCLGLLGPV